MRKGGRAISDDELAGLVLQGDQDAYRKLVERHRSALYGVIWGVLRDQKDAEDALQEAFVRMYLSLPQYKGPSFKAWAARIAVNIAIDARRKRMRTPEPVAITAERKGAVPIPVLKKRAESAGVHLPVGYSEPAEAVALERDRRSRLRQMVEAMPGHYGRVVRLFYFEERNQREIAAEERIELKSVESRLYRAKQWMRKHWKEEDLE